MTLLVLYFLATVVTSFTCSLMEAVVLSTPTAYIALLEKRGRRSGRILHDLHRHIDRPLAAILTLNTIANTIGSMMVANQVLKIYGDEALAVASGLVTVVILVFGEIIPKTIGANYPKRLSPFAAYTVQGMVYITWPFVWLARVISHTITGSVKKRKTSREEMIAAAEIGANEGVIHQKESAIIKNLLMLDTIKVADIMTPKPVVHAFDINDTVGGILEKYKPVRYSRIPLYDGNIDNVVGVLYRYRLMEAASADLFSLSLRELRSPIFKVPVDMPVSNAIDHFLKRREHLFLAVEGKGKTAGIVTLEDAVETLLGVEIIDELDSVTNQNQYALEQWRLKRQAYTRK